MKRRRPAPDLERVRQLDRALDLLRRGRIPFERWAETVTAWSNGEDVSAWDYGDAEALSARIVRCFPDEPFGTVEAAYLLGAKRSSIESALSRMVARGLATKGSDGNYLAQGPATKRVPT